MQPHERLHHGRHSPDDRGRWLYQVLVKRDGRTLSDCGNRLHWEADSTMIDRSEVNRALAKAIAFKQCGKDQTAAAWAVRLVRLLELEGILDPANVATAFAGERTERQKTDY